MKTACETRFCFSCLLDALKKMHPHSSIHFFDVSFLFSFIDWSTKRWQIDSVESDNTSASKSSSVCIHNAAATLGNCALR